MICCSTAQDELIHIFVATVPVLLDSLFKVGSWGDVSVFHSWCSSADADAAAPRVLQQGRCQPE